MQYRRLVLPNAVHDLQLRALDSIDQCGWTAIRQRVITRETHAMELVRRQVFGIRNAGVFHIEMPKAQKIIREHSGEVRRSTRKSVVRLLFERAHFAADAGFAKTNEGGN